MVNENLLSTVGNTKFELIRFEFFMGNDFILDEVKFVS